MITTIWKIIVIFSIAADFCSFNDLSHLLRFFRCTYLFHQPHLHKSMNKIELFQYLTRSSNLLLNG